MATTSPDGIRSPNPTDPYNLVADWAITANDVQAVFNKRANMYIGTSTQRTAFTTAPNGVFWQDTNGSQNLFVRRSGAWVVKTQSGLHVYNATVGGGPVSGWEWTGVLSFTYPVAYPAGLTPAVTATAVTGDQLQTVTITAASNTGFSYRVMRLSGTPTATGTLHWIASV